MPIAPMTHVPLRLALPPFDQGWRTVIEPVLGHSHDLIIILNSIKLSRKIDKKSQKICPPQRSENPSPLGRMRRQDEGDHCYTVEQFPTGTKSLILNAYVLLMANLK